MSVSTVPTFDTSNGSLKDACAVRPPVSRVATIPDDAAARVVVEKTVALTEG